MRLLLNLAEKKEENKNGRNGKKRENVSKQVWLIIFFCMSIFFFLLSSPVGLRIMCVHSCASILLRWGSHCSTATHGLHSLMSQSKGISRRLRTILWCQTRHTHMYMNTLTQSTCSPGTHLVHTSTHTLICT